MPAMFGQKEHFAFMSHGMFFPLNVLFISNSNFDQSNDIYHLSIAFKFQIINKEWINLNSIYKEPLVDISKRT